ncbi:hypothetical protein AAG565_12285 [Fontimonas sp. SYSU GA230001]|uniref:hypothetical protein n=1 Tax=Fontimonas sp. SYSU GA230001 TaxID=3142450 RepID=UPI0032B5E85D
MNRWLARAALAALTTLLCACASDDGADPAPPADPAGDAPCVLSAEVRYPIPDSPLFTLDPLGPLQDVTCAWTHYQPAGTFCVKLDAAELTPGGTGTLTDGRDPACASSGFDADATGLYKVAIDTPPLCPGCRRLFIDLGQIPEGGARGHAFYAIASFNPSYTIDPFAHSPNTKNFTNDELVSPPGTPLAMLVNAGDAYFKAYVTHTTRFAHTALQGPFYIGPWYVNRDGQRINGVYVDVDVASAQNLGTAELNAMRYVAGYNDGTASCPDNLLGDYAGANLLYAGCATHPGTSAVAIDPFP